MGEFKRKGGCLCGAVEIEIEGDPAAQAYCHCQSCRGWLGAPIHGATLWPTPKVTVTKGEDKLGVYKRTDASHRQFCTSCGTGVLVRHPSLGMTDVPSVNIQGFTHEPTLHVHYGEKVMQVKDGLPMSDLTIACPNTRTAPLVLHLARGEAAPASALVAEASALTAKSGDRRYLAELVRIDGQVCLAGGDLARARERFEEAKAIAHSLGQKWHELRATLALAKLLESQGQATEARSLLEPVVAAIDEGADLQELRDARSMLGRSS